MYLKKAALGSQNIVFKFPAEKVFIFCYKRTDWIVCGPTTVLFLSTVAFRICDLSGVIYFFQVVYLHLHVVITS